MNNCCPHLIDWICPSIKANYFFFLFLNSIPLLFKKVIAELSTFFSKNFCGKSHLLFRIRLLQKCWREQTHHFWKVLFNINDRFKSATCCLGCLCELCPQRFTGTLHKLKVTVHLVSQYELYVGDRRRLLTLGYLFYCVNSDLQYFGDTVVNFTFNIYQK